MSKPSTRLSALLLCTTLMLPSAYTVLAEGNEDSTDEIAADTSEGNPGSETAPEGIGSKSDSEGAENATAPQAGGTCSINGTVYANIQEAVNAAADGDTIELTADETNPVTIPAGRTVTIKVASGVTWTNSSAPGVHWENSVINNYGNLTLISEGTVKPAEIKSQTMALFNRPGATASIQGGVFTSDHGDYIIWNQGTMTIGGGAQILKPHAGSPTAVISGWLNNASIGGNPAAKLTITDAVVDAAASGGIAIKNDDNSILDIQGGNFKAWTTAVQNSNTATISGGNFTTIRNGSFSLYNYYGNDTYNKGILTITGGNFYAGAENVQAIRDVAGANGKIEISGGTYFADQDCVKDHIISPYVLRPIGDRFEVIIPVTQVTLDPSEQTIKEQESLTVNGTVIPADAKYPQITWSVSDQEILQIESSNSDDPANQNVTIKGLKPGQAEVIANADGVEAKAIITVEEAPVSLSLDPSSATLKEEECLQIKAVIEPESAAGSVIEWTSSAPEVASVDENGLVKAVKTGTATITAKIDGAEASCEITVEAREDQKPGEGDDNKPSNPGDDNKPSNPGNGNNPSGNEGNKKPASAQKPTSSSKPAKKPSTSTGTFFGIFAGALAASGALLAVLKRKISD